jgi:PAS domain S-box-containing protein
VELSRVTTGQEILTGAPQHDFSGWPATDAELRAWVEGGPDALVIVEPTGCIVLVNSMLEQLFGYAPAELLDRRLTDLLPPRLRAAHRDDVTRYLENPAPPSTGVGFELVAQRKDGSEFSVEIRWGRMATTRGTLVAAAVRDVSKWVRREDRRREASDRELGRESAARLATEGMNERLVSAIVHEHALTDIARRASEAKSRFLATMSHELRIPLNAITGYTGLIDEGIGGPVTAKQREYLGKIQNASRHLVGLIDDVLDLAKIEAGQVRLDPQRASASDAVAGSLALLETLAADAEVTPVIVDLCPDSNHYMGDPDRVRQVLVNLLSNAVKFTDRGGRVTVTCGRSGNRPAGATLPGDGPWTFFSVQDTGIGIAPDDAAALFQPFVRARATKSRPGTGLGLAISRELARLMGGDLTVTSILGVGSCFTLLIPADAASDSS